MSPPTRRAFAIWGKKKMFPIEIREKLELTQEEFATLVGADVRSVARWEAGDCEPTGTSKQVLAAILAIMQKQPENAEALKKLLSFYAKLGGLAFMVFDLIDRAVCGDANVKN
jgi:transcriptional regulator with XRE-family HTH domain